MVARRALRFASGSPLLPAGGEIHQPFSFDLERGIPPSDLQHPPASFPLRAKHGKGVAARCLRSKPQLRRMGAKIESPLLPGWLCRPCKSNRDFLLRAAAGGGEGGAVRLA